MAYKVIKPFRDKTDNRKLYPIGSVYEHEDKKRIEFLIQQGYIVEDSNEEQQNKKSFFKKEK
jgi:hypothetical protein